ncbi:xanthine dehydrogenase small subunit [Salinicola endophyticus]|uniref:Xanthine dehydrogenase small subunit n=1 Tax=Salinicola endophyticus TaxID=1949083 RepID=A0ABY8FMW9_9GAMM|nr:xanthine dehydrogenase small subunit [Salinicola endophyticus]WFF43028.1 xanthine dehydrogenase small subunit [Salinicola endophyticus]
MIEFFLNGRRQCVEAAPGTSVLELLRETLGHCGTKEGCASGDCGACTVAIAEAESAQPAPWRTANACITPAHQLQGCHLVTVEGLAQGEALHPAQAAMVECHASQCGFCTPGIVMSLFALHESRRQVPATPLASQTLEAALGGNLCRCTGYRPIRDAAHAMSTQPDSRPAWAEDASLESAWRALGRASCATHYHTPQHLTELKQLRREHPQAPLVAGATDLWLGATQRLEQWPVVIDLRQVAELRRIEAEEAGWWIGAAVTYREWEPLLQAHYPAFAHLLERLGSAQIRHRATVGGNIANASPIGDTPPVLLALEARLRLAGPEGERELPLSAFFLDYRKTALRAGECIVAIWLPRPEPDAQLRVWKLSKRREDDISTLLGAFHWRQTGERLHDVRVAFGGMAATPLRVPTVEAALEGKPATSETFADAKHALRAALTPLDDVRGSAEYRLTAAANLLERWALTLDPSRDDTQEVALDAYAH